MEREIGYYRTMKKGDTSYGITFYNGWGWIDANGNSCFDIDFKEIGEKIEPNPWMSCCEELPPLELLVRVIDSRTKEMRYACRFAEDGEWTWCISEDAFIEFRNGKWNADCYTAECYFSHWQYISNFIP